MSLTVRFECADDAAAFSEWCGSYVSQHRLANIDYSRASFVDALCEDEALEPFLTIWSDYVVRVGVAR